MTLEHHLSGFYKQYVMLGSSMEEASKDIKKAISENAGMAEEATRKLDELTKLDNATGGKLSQRCYVSHIYKMALEEALND